MIKIALLAAIAAFAGPTSAATWLIGDNDGYGLGIPDNAVHAFNGARAGFDGRSAAEKAATDGAQFTDTYSAGYPDYGPDTGTTVTFTFSELGSGWSAGTMIFDMADFQANEYGAVAATFNGITQAWAFNDGFPNTRLRVFNLSNAVLSAINLIGTLTVAIDRNRSVDFYGFDYAALSSEVVSEVEVPGLIPGVPEPGTYAMMVFGLAAVGAIAARRRTGA